MARRSGPGLAKTDTVPLLQTCVVELWRSADYCWRAAFETADVMSEGAIRNEQQGPVYYGSTSVVLPLVSCGGTIPDEHVETALRLLNADPHARLRVVRIACLEAQLRSSQPLRRVATETFIRRDALGIRLDVEVEAEVVAPQARRRAGG